ncbi:hypothetical protein N7451_012815 [Penicillium sp. IBT 35674x]|nr:hypothetical protein N7451_012815 [Penicillium sp. IBT 35674x]
MGESFCLHHFHIRFGFKSLFRRFLWFIISLFVVLLGYYLLVPQLLRFRFRADLTWYDFGLYGFAPSRDYLSYSHASPLLGFIQTDVRCSRDYIFFAPNGDSIPEPVPVILDSDGELVWRLSEMWKGVAQDFKVQRYKDEDFLTFWVGEEIDGRKQGFWYMLDSSYNVRYTLSPGGSFTTGDMHEFYLTPAGTALVVIYDPIPADLTSIGGPSEGWILDGVVQEIQIETGDIHFQWRASDHFSVNDTFHKLTGCQETHTAAFAGCGNAPISAFDFFHLNSVEKDSSGNYLISSRYTHTINAINGTDGSLIWTLGGKSNDFHDLSVDGSATGFSWQHHARWYGNRSITLFDNAVEDNSDPSIESRALILDLDLENRQVDLRAAYSHPQQMESVSLGSVQVLQESGNIFVGWGHSAAFTEFTSDGSVLCNFHYGPSAWNTFGRTKSYRVFRGRWIGRPTQPPNVTSKDGKLYVSWNGATEVDRWQLEMTGDNDDKFSIISQTQKSGFETVIGHPSILLPGSSLRVLALDVGGNILGQSDLLELPVNGSTPWIIISITAIMSVLAVLAIVLLGMRQRQTRRGSRQYQLLQMST